MKSINIDNELDCKFEDNKNRNQEYRLEID
jgi:hypothetical protein